MCWGFLKWHGGGRKRKGIGIGNSEAAEAVGAAEVAEHHLTDEEMRALFKKYDGNGDGHLDKSELTKAFKELGCHFPGWRASHAIQQNDFDLDGDIDEHEIDHLISYARSLGL